LSCRVEIAESLKSSFWSKPNNLASRLDNGLRKEIRQIRMGCAAEISVYLLPAIKNTASTGTGWAQPCKRRFCDRLPLHRYSGLPPSGSAALLRATGLQAPAAL
jgi:hypothetical protein